MVPIVGTVPTYMSLIQENGRRTHCAGTGGVATLFRAVPRNVPRPPSSPESAAERPRGVLAVLYRISWYIFGAAERPRGVLAVLYRISWYVFSHQSPKH